MTLCLISPRGGRGFRQRYGLGDKFLVTHSGNMGVKQGLDVIVDAAALNRADGSTLFLLVGGGAVRERIQNRVADLGLENVRLLPLLEEEDFRGLLAASDICLVTQQKSVSDIVFPSKIVTYLAAGRPVIASVSSGRRGGAGDSGVGSRQPGGTGRSGSASGGNSRFARRGLAAMWRECAEVRGPAVVIRASSGPF